MKANFKIKDHPDERTRTLYFSFRGRLVTVSHYDLADSEDITEEDWDVLLERDAQVFLRGFNYRE